MSVRLDARDPALLLSPSARLLHLGLPKTGTTALQHRAAAQRPRLREQGVLYPGKRHNHRREGLAFAGRAPGWGRPDAVPRVEAWQALRARVHAAPDLRVWLSHENFAEMSEAKLRELARQVGGDVHAVLTLRSLPALLASAWSQYLKSGLTADLDTWAAGVLSDPPDPEMTPNFRRRTDLSGIVQKCLAAFGSDHVTVVVLDPADRELVPRTFETLLGLSRGTLTGGSLPPNALNRSFTSAEAELLRQVNVRLSPRTGMAWSDYNRYVFKGAVDRLLERVPDEQEPRPVPPRWAVERAVELAQGHQRAIEATDVRVVGDLAHLGLPVPGRDGPAPAPLLPVDAAAGALHAVVEAALLHTPSTARTLPATPLAAAPSAVLARTLAERAAGRAGRWLSRVLPGSRSAG